jgi:hypothetical protein
MKEYRFTLEKKQKKGTCISCGKHNVSVRYIDTLTGNHLPEIYSRCDREVNCNYHLSPYKDGYAKMLSGGACSLMQMIKPKPPLEKPTSFIDNELLKKSLHSYDVNNFIKYLKTILPAKEVKKIIELYKIGTSKHWEGSTIFWQVDNKGRIRGGKVMLYDAVKGKRVKEPFNHITWAHSALKLNDYNLKQCLFGSHLLTDENKNTSCAIVESEKTAIIASAYLPDFIWLACGSLSNLTFEKCKVLSGRNVFLFPDLNGFEKWSERAKELSAITPFDVSDLLEQNATEAEKETGLDIADYLIRFDYKEFIKKEFSDNIIHDQVQDHVQDLKGLLTKKPELWDVEGLEDFFNSTILPAQPVKIDVCGTITDVCLFVNSHIATAKANNGNRTYLPYFERLLKLKNILT